MGGRDHGQVHRGRDDDGIGKLKIVIPSFDGNSSVDEYYKEMEILMIRTGVNEIEEATMARFFNGLNEDIQERVEIVTYQDLQELVHQAARAERHIKQRQARSSNTNSSSQWRHSIERSGAPNAFSTHKSTGKELAPSKVESSNGSTSRTSSIQCHTCKGRGHVMKDCPNAKKVLLTKDGYATADSCDESETEGKDEAHCTFETGTPLSSDGGDGVNLLVRKVARDDTLVAEKGQRHNPMVEDKIKVKKFPEVKKYPKKTSKPKIMSQTMFLPMPHCRKSQRRIEQLCTLQRYHFKFRALSFHLFPHHSGRVRHV
ncbi:hypothetical protein BRADI_2g31573v3 [Brachypodium distachyon]|uniref:CCHC-type domain-containing protein n=1 Tax=Brachypodium distachyon TaxID=15368 RepID=A0A2K2DBC4_BRADI|nr:hypothetical protein BRADI_2g31573v3 [Brachypodium distachyon]